MLFGLQRSHTVPFATGKKGLKFAGQPGGKALFQEVLQQASWLEERMVRLPGSQHCIQLARILSQLHLSF